MSSTNKTEHYNLPQFIGSDIPTWLGDFNSAMTAIDSGINAAATSASGAATDAAAAATSASGATTTAAQALTKANDAWVAANRCPFPVGFGGFFQSDPNAIYSGTTWAQKQDVFILAAGNAYPAGSTGGEASHMLTVDEMPRHSHTVYCEGSGTSATTVHRIAFDSWNRNSTKYTQDGVETTATGGSQPHNNMPPYYSMPFWVRTA